MLSPTKSGVASQGRDSISESEEIQRAHEAMQAAAHASNHPINPMQAPGHSLPMFPSPGGVSASAPAVLLHQPQQHNQQPLASPPVLALAAFVKSPSLTAANVASLAVPSPQRPSLSAGSHTHAHTHAASVSAGAGGPVVGVMKSPRVKGQARAHMDTSDDGKVRNLVCLF